MNCSDIEDGSRLRQRDNYNSIPDTCSYKESQLVTPYESLKSNDHGATYSQRIDNLNTMPTIGEYEGPKLVFVDDSESLETFSFRKNVQNINRDLAKMGQISKTMRNVLDG